MIRGQDLRDAAIVGPADNPHEVVDVVCSRCRERVTMSRQELQEAAWGRVVDQLFEQHPGFWVCPEHRGEQYAWEDLY